MLRHASISIEVYAVLIDPSVATPTRSEVALRPARAGAQTKNGRRGTAPVTGYGC
jgi:hypothetical protein